MNTPIVNTRRDFFAKLAAGLVGEDSFTYRRTTADPTDPLNGHEYTVAVTVR